VREMFTGEGTWRGTRSLNKNFSKGVGTLAGRKGQKEGGEGFLQRVRAVEIC